MSTLENTVSMMQVLPEADLVEIQAFTKKLFQRHGDGIADEAVGRFLKPMSREDFLRDVAVAEQEIVDGKCSSAEEVFDELERRYRV